MSYIDVIYNLAIYGLADRPSISVKTHQI